MARLFIAIDPSSEVSSYLRSLQDGLPGKLVNSFHLTLLFLGETDVDEATFSFKKVSFERLCLSLDKRGAFPDAKRPKVLWVGLKDDEALMRLQNQIASLFPDIPKEINPFHPHLTIARVKDLGSDARQRISAWISRHCDQLRFEADSIRLYKSTLTPEGPVYEVISTVFAK
ncbi:MAG: RNA 2',3'-cyclic phosphodiesterase [Candidatus Nanoarchaeia archaeon]